MVLINLVAPCLLASLNFQCCLTSRSSKSTPTCQQELQIVHGKTSEDAPGNTLMQWCGHRGENGLRDAVKDLDFSPAHKDKVLAATCEDGSCSLWAWEQQLQIAVLDLPQGESPLFFTA